MRDTTAGAAIYYTTDGSDPTQSSRHYTRSFTISSSETINAKAFKAGYNPSDTTTAVFNRTRIAEQADIRQSEDDDTIEPETSPNPIR